MRLYFDNIEFMLLVYTNISSLSGALPLPIMTAGERMRTEIVSPERQNSFTTVPQMTTSSTYCSRLIFDVPVRLLSSSHLTVHLPFQIPHFSSKSPPPQAPQEKRKAEKPWCVPPSKPNPRCKQSPSSVPPTQQPPQETSSRGAEEPTPTRRTLDSTRLDSRLFYS